MMRKRKLIYCSGFEGNENEQILMKCKKPGEKIYFQDSFLQEGKY